MTNPYSYYLLSLSLVVNVVIAPFTKAEVPAASVANSSVEATPILHRNDLDNFHTRANRLVQPFLQNDDSPTLAQAPASPITVIDVRITQTEIGVDVQLLTADGQLLPVGEQTQQGNTLIVDIPNAVLDQPDGEPFSVEDPSTGIESVRVTQWEETIVRLEIVGQVSPPSATTSQGASGLVVSAVLAQGLDDVLVMDEVVVTGVRQRGSRYAPVDAITATRIEERLQDIPQSIQVIPRQVFEDRQSTRLDDALRTVSGVTFSGTDLGRTTEFNLRGFDDEAPLFRNGFNQFGAGSTIPDLANIERIEVLKGPVAGLYGEVEPGGVINLVTKRPLSEPSYTIQTQFGNRELIRPSIDITGPITADGSLAYRLNAVYQNDGDFIDVETETERVFVAPVITWAIGERTNLTVELEYLNEVRPPVFGVPAIEDSIADISFDNITNQPDDVAKEESLNVGYDFEHRFNDNWRIRNAFRYTEQNAELEVAFPLSVDDSGAVTRFFGFQPEDATSYSLQTNVVGEFETGPVEHTLLIGLDLNTSEDNFNSTTRLDIENPLLFNIFDPDFDVPSRPDPDDLPLIQDDVTQTDRIGIFVQEKISLGDTFILLAGFRYDLIDQTTTINPTDFDPISFDINQTEDKISPRVGIVYRPIENISIFANYSQSFTPNSETTSDSEPLDFEEGEGFEVGTRFTFIDDRLSASVAYFNITKQNVASVDPDDPFSFIATGEQRSQGVELDIAGEILPGWNIIAAYTFLDAEVSKDTFIDTGNRLPNAPEHSASVWTTYEIQSGQLEGLGFGLGFDFVGEREGDLENTFQVDSYFLTNASISYRRNSLEAAITARNLFEVDYIAGTSLRERGNDPGEPFTILGTLSYEF